jgi:hypothetical protein
MKTSIREIEFARETTFLGRNGTFKASGLDITAGDEGVLLQPVTSKGMPGRSYIAIPMENLDELIAELRRIAALRDFPCGVAGCVVRH